jgi:hypothetical protein
MASFLIETKYEFRDHVVFERDDLTSIVVQVVAIRVHIVLNKYVVFYDLLDTSNEGDEFEFVPESQILGKYRQGEAFRTFSYPLIQLDRIEPGGVVETKPHVTSIDKGNRKKKANE